MNNRTPRMLNIIGLFKPKYLKMQSVDSNGSERYKCTIWIAERGKHLVWT